MATTIYEPLKEWQTRLLRLHPGSGADKLRGDLLKADLVPIEQGLVLHHREELVQFEALSYCWGAPDFSFQIRIGEQVVQITRSLGIALQFLRQAHEARWLWVDALCINQADDTEKSFQVRNMFMMYSRASTVVVWLGEAGQHTESAIKYARVEHQRRQRCSSAVPKDGQNWPAMIYDGLVELVSRDWIRRVWVQQEIFAARNSVIYCGDEHFASLDEYRTVAFVLEDGPAPEEPFPRDVLINIDILKQMRSRTLRREAELELDRRTGRYMEPCKCSYDPVESTNIECLLFRSTNLRATDARDRIFALLHLSNCKVAQGPPDDEPHNDGILFVDYTASASVVFQNLMKHLINRDKSYEHLLDYYSASTRHGNTELPSWCPDWRDFWHYRWGRAADKTRQIAFQRQSYQAVGILAITAVPLAVRSCPKQERQSGRSKTNQAPQPDSWIMTTDVSRVVPSNLVGILAERLENLDRGPGKSSKRLYSGCFEQGDILVMLDVFYANFRTIVLRPRAEGDYIYVRPCGEIYSMGDMYVPGPSKLIGAPEVNLADHLCDLASKQFKIF